MTQIELIEFCKKNDPSYNKDASFKVIEPMWSIPKGVGGIGVTESEFKNGFYVQIDTKGRKGFEHLEGRVFYFKIEQEWRNTQITLYNTHWKKYFVPLDDLENWGKEITSHIYDKCVTETDFVVDLCMTGNRETVGKGIIEQIEPPIKYEPMTPEELEAQKTLYDSVQSLEAINPVEEFPIQKIHTQTVYSKNNTTFIFGKNPKSNVVTFSIQFEKLEITEQQFSDLVDLMIEARKDLLK